MFNVKLLVLLIYINLETCLANKYCDICSNHVLCQYVELGPSVACKRYDDSALLTKDDINDIVYKINDRRNTIALGFSSNLPQAANMRKISWSDELAGFAQRWADQCEASLRPDRQDQCRDLARTAVGQNIATIPGPSPGIQVKSFIDTWFIQTLDYTGSASYYNRSQDSKTNYFTQLIWAETDIVGCGKARFTIELKKTELERLVCNFAPKGNVHGKPVYSIGFPATQCPANMGPDVIFRGLCSISVQSDKENTSKITPLSILRILNLSNNSSKQEIDPIRNNLKLSNLNGNETNYQRNQKIRHVRNNTYGGMQYGSPQRMGPPQRMPPPWKSPITAGNQGMHGFQPERGHSRVYHGHDTGLNFLSQRPYTARSDQELRKYDYTTQPLNLYTTSNYRRYHQKSQCTRKVPCPTSDCQSPTNSCCVPKECTRGRSNCYLESTLPCNLPAETTHECDEYSCTCNTLKSNCPIIVTPCHCDANNKCHDQNIQNPCQKIGRSQENIKDDTKKSAELHYIDLFPNLGVRSGETISKNPPHRSVTFSNKNAWYLRNTALDKNLKTEKSLDKREEYHQNDKQVKDVFEYPKYVDQERDYLYGSFDSSERQRREPEDQMTFKPFWQMEEYSYKNPLQLKSIVYTTFGKKRNRKTSLPTVKPGTEPITIKLKEVNRHSYHGDHIKEKYLSFDELMHLRKMNSESYNARRTIEVSSKQTTPIPAASILPTSKPYLREVSEEEEKKVALAYTMHPPFQKKKYCTRAVTCTWTEATMTNSDGSIIKKPEGGGSGGRGSRTPPGYVEGCTRTSTCTRDYMDRNKMATITNLIPGDGDATGTLEDEDYCERRALNVQRRDSDEKDVAVHNGDTQEQHFASQVTGTTSILNDDETTTISDCICNQENARMKRENNKNYKDHVMRGRCESYCDDKEFSYGDLYSNTIRKIIKLWGQKNLSLHLDRCLCNTSFVVRNNIVFVIFLVIYDIIMSRVFY